MCSWATAFDDIANILVSKQYLQSSVFIPLKISLIDNLSGLSIKLCILRCFQVCFVFETLHNVEFY
jgi:hypothetical protein